MYSSGERPLRRKKTQDVSVYANRLEVGQPRLIYKPHSWVTIRARLEWGVQTPPQQVQASACEGFLGLIDAGAKAGADGIQALLSKAMIEFLSKQAEGPYSFAGFCGQFAGQAKGVVLDRETARVLPYAGTPAWPTRYVVNATRNDVKGMISLLGSFVGNIVN